MQGDKYLPERTSMNNNHHKRRYKLKQTEQLDIANILKIINKRKILLISIIVAVLGIALVYTLTKDPVYQATVLLKKEKQQKRITTDELSKIINLQTEDEIETELALIKTWDVLGKVLDEQDLFLTVKKIVNNDGSEIEIDKQMPVYKKDFSSDRYPKFTSIGLNDSKLENTYYIEKLSSGNYGLFDAETNDKLQNIIAEDDYIVNFPSFKMNFHWENAKVGSKVYFYVNSYHKALNGLSGMLSVSQKAKTNVFTISAESTSPYLAQLIANSVTEKYRESRIDQQKQTIRYSFKFVDQNLSDIQQKLEEAEKNLMQFKAQNQIMDISGSSQDLIDFISNVEAEKMRTELELTQYQNKASEMGSELKEKGYFDQTYLAPQGNEQNNSPFSALMKQLSDLELKKLELLQKRTENHPEVQKIQEQIDQVEEKLSTYNQSTLTSYNIIINTLDKKDQQLTNMLNKYEGKLRVLPRQESQLATLIREKNVYDKMYTLLLDKREEMRMAELSKLQDIVVVDKAHEPIEPISPNKKFNMIVALLLGTLFGLVGVFLVEIRNKKFVDVDDVERDFNYPLFAIIPVYPKELKDKVNDEDNTEYDDKFVALMDEELGFKESYRVLKTKLMQHLDETDNMVMFTSCEENTGKTTIVANLAINLAQSDKKVLLVDGDMRKGTLSRLFNLSNHSHGLISYLKGESPSFYIFKEVIGSLDILPTDGVCEDSSELLTGKRLKDLYNMLKSFDYDYILFDTPPVTRVVDTLVLGKIINKSVLILRPDHSYKESVYFGVREMEEAHIKILGTVINACNIEKSSYRHRYGYGYGYKYTYKLPAA